jgi:hypothetical protein
MDKTDNQIWIPSVKTYIAVLKAEIQHLESKLEPHDMGHIHTTISTLKHRVKELEKNK